MSTSEWEDLLTDTRCRRLSPDHKFLCVLEQGHEGNHVGRLLTQLEGESNEH